MENADYNNNSLANGRLVRVLKGNVRFKYGYVSIKSDRATWYRGNGRAQFPGSIEVSMKTQTLKCKRIDFNRDSNTITAKNSVDFFDSSENVRFTSENALYDFNSKYLTLSKSPIMFN